LWYSNYMNYLRALLTTSLFLAASSTASAQMLVIGQGAAAKCYQYAKIGNVGSKRAIETCDTAFNDLLSYKNKTATHVNRGILLMRAGEYDAAARDYERALEMKPDMTAAYVNYGANLIQQGRDDEAMTALNTALADADSPTRPEALYNRAVLHDRAENYKAAYQDLKMALELRPDWPLAETLIARYTVIPKS